MVKEWKSLSVGKDIYLMVKAKQNEMIEKNKGDNVELSYVTELAIMEGLDKVTLNEWDEFGEKKIEKEE